METVRSSFVAVEEIKQKVLGSLNGEGETIDEDTADSSLFKLMGSASISKRFMEWLVATDNIQEVLDLIK